MSTNDQYLNSIQKWVLSEIAIVMQQGYSTTHLDQLLSIDSGWLLNNFGEAEKICIEALTTLARIEVAGRFVVSIRFDLGYRELVTKEFELTQLHGPAALYIIDLRIFNLPSNEEIHRFPLEACSSPVQGYQLAKFIEYTRLANRDDTEPYSVSVFLDIYPELSTIIGGK